MSDGWSKLRDIDPLADGHADIDFEIPLAEFPRLRPQLARTEGSARGRVHFARELGLPVADVEFATEAVLTCQRCLEPMRWPVEGRGRVIMVAEEEQADRLPGELETILAADNRISIRELVEEELLLSMPIAPVHDPGECAASAPEAPVESAPDAQHRQRPFERLGELLKRDKSE